MNRRRLERPTHGLEGRCSIQLSYRSVDTLIIILQNKANVNIFFENIDIYGVATQSRTEIEGFVDPHAIHYTIATSIYIIEFFTCFVNDVDINKNIYEINM